MSTSRSRLPEALAGTVFRIVVGALALTGCGTQHIRAHAGTETQGAVATLRANGNPWANDGAVEVERIDGVPVGEEKPAFGSQEIEILPGVHNVEVSLRGKSISNARVSFEAAPGGQYEVQVTSVREGFWAEMRLAFAGGTQRWVAWVVDLQTDQVVGGLRPEQGVFTTDLSKGSVPPPSSHIVVSPPQQQ